MSQAILKFTALVLSWQPNEYAERELSSNETYSTSLLPGLVIPLDESFAE